MSLSLVTVQHHNKYQRYQQTLPLIVTREIAMKMRRNIHVPQRNVLNYFGDLLTFLSKCTIKIFGLRQIAEKEKACWQIMHVLVRERKERNKGHQGNLNGNRNKYFIVVTDCWMLKCHWSTGTGTEICCKYQACLIWGDSLQRKAHFHTAFYNLAKSNLKSSDLWLRSDFSPSHVWL